MDTNVSNGAAATPVCLPALVARQPVIDLAGNIFGYELLFDAAQKKDVVHASDGGQMDADAAPLATIANALFAIGLDRLTDNKQAFINVTLQVLGENLMEVLPPDRTIVELADTPAATADVIAACKRARDAGYKLVLNDVEDIAAVENLLPHIDLVKVDSSEVVGDRRRELYGQLRSRNVQIIAGNVETQEDRAECEALGAKYFQGFFFAEPVILEGRKLTASETGIMQLMRTINEDACDFGTVESLIKHDAALSYQFLRYLNSAAMGIRNRVTSIRQGLALLGLKPLRKWVSLLALNGLSRNQCRPLLLNCVIRARLCEMLARGEELDDLQLDSFMLGLLSGFDAVLGMPLHEVLEQMGVCENLQSVLLGRPATNESLARFHAIMLGCERGDWTAVMEASISMRQTQSEIAMVYYEAMDWANQLVNEVR